MTTLGTGALTVGAIFQSNNYGQFRVVSDDGWKSVCVEFIDTKYRAVVQRSDARNGNVKDLIAPKICGVGFISDGGRATGKAYGVWKSMLARCYNPKVQQKQPAYIGCTVVPEWHDFRCFEKWFELNYSDGLHLDKDIKWKGNRIYGPDTCLFVTPEENSIAAHAKHYVFLSPSGLRHEIYNMVEFALEHGLNNKNMSQVNRGQRQHHKGWTKYSNQQAQERADK